MKEFGHNVMSPDELILKHGVKHQDSLNMIRERLKGLLDEKVLFSPDSAEEINSWFYANKEDVLAGLSKDFTEFRQMKSSDAQGHNFSHLIDNLNTALRVFEEYGDMSDAEKLETVYAIMGHDTGRYVERELDKTSPKDTLYLMPAFMGRKFDGVMALPEILRKRILFNIANGPVPKKDIRTADTVSQCDREQLLGGLMFARDIAFFAANGNIRFGFPRNDNFKKQLPLPDDQNDEQFMIQMEFFMRNIYPATSPDGVAVRRENIKENAVVLLLAAHRDEELEKQIFAPELESSTGNDSHWSKKPLPEGVFDEARHERDGFLSGIDIKGFEDGMDFAVIKKLMAAENIGLTTEQEQLVEERLVECTEAERRNAWLIAQYGLAKRHGKRIRDIEKLEGLEEKGGVSAIVAGWVKDNLAERERQFSNVPIEGEHNL